MNQKNWLRRALLFAAAIYALPVHAAWVPQTSGTTVGLTDVQFRDTSTGWVTGQAGTILKTTDAGLTWIPQVSGVGVDLIAIHMVSSTTGWMAGRGGTVLKTTDGGTTWSPQTTGTGAWLHGVLFLDETTGWVNGASGTIRKTTDGGATWLGQASGTTNTLVSLFFLDDQRGWAVGQNRRVLGTVNAGATWTTLSTGTFHVLEDLHFANATDGWVVGRSGISRVTTDGGVTWNDQFLAADWLKGLEFVTPTTARALGTSGKIFFTTDAGATWGIEPSGVVVSLWKSSFPETGTGWIVGKEGTILSLQITTSVNPERHFAVSTMSPPAPNPFRGSTRVQFTVADRQRPSLTVLDLRGRFVREIPATSLGGLDFEGTWDGSTSAGRPAAPGVYFLRVGSGAQTQAQAVHLVR